jgi:hypothetical protein
LRRSSRASSANDNATIDAVISAAPIAQPPRPSV